MLLFDEGNADHYTTAGN